MCLNKDGAYAKIQMWLSAKWVSAHLRKHFQTNAKMGTENSQHKKCSGTKLGFAEVTNLSIPLVRTPEALWVCEQLSQISRSFPSAPEYHSVFPATPVTMLWYQDTGPEWDILLPPHLYGSCYDDLIKSYLDHQDIEIDLQTQALWHKESYLTLKVGESGSVQYRLKSIVDQSFQLIYTVCHKAKIPRFYFIFVLAQYV